MAAPAGCVPGVHRARTPLHLRPPRVAAKQPSPGPGLQGHPSPAAHGAGAQRTGGGDPCGASPLGQSAELGGSPASSGDKEDCDHVGDRSGDHL
jgi:hypothetical protein